MSTYVCSDIHGQYDLYLQMLDRIKLGPEDRLYILGDLIDRGPKSMEVLLDASRRENVTCLLGNHELMMYDCLVKQDPWVADRWILPANGGRKNRKAFEALSLKEQEEALAFLSRLLLQAEVKIGDTTFLLSHSAFLPDLGTVGWREVDEDTAFTTVWYSPWREREHLPMYDYRQDGRVHVIGHVPVQRINTWPLEDGEEDIVMPKAYDDPDFHIVNIDLGCALASRGLPGVWAGLCCMNLEAYAAGDKEKAFTYFEAGGSGETPPGKNEKQEEAPARILFT